jgi:type I restriction enzyme S subunit
MKEGWEYIAFKDVYPIKMGKTPPRGDKSSWDEKKETHNKWVSIADISNNEGKTIEDTKEYISDSAAEKINKVSKGSLLMSFKLSIGRMAFAGDDLYTNEAIIAIPKNDKYILRFIYFYLLSYDWLSLTEGSEKVKGATLNKSSIGKIQLPILSLSEQQSIVDYLDSAFAKIDAMKANAEKALNEAKALFQASLKEMLEPKEGWEEQKFGKVCWYNKNNGLHKGTKYIGMEHIEQGTGNLLGTISSDDVLSNTFAFNKGDVLYGRLRPYLKKVIVADFDGCCSTEIFPIQSQNIIASFLMYWFLTDKITNKVNATCAGCRMPRGNMNEVLKFDISYPSIAEQHDIVTTLDSLKSKVDRLQENYDKISLECDALKQAILRKVFEG